MRPMLTIVTLKTFIKVSHVYENFVRTLMYMFRNTGSVKVKYRLLYITFSIQFNDRFYLKDFAVLCMMKKLDELWKTTPDLVPTVRFGIPRITL